MPPLGARWAVGLPLVHDDRIFITQEARGLGDTNGADLASKLQQFVACEMLVPEKDDLMLVQSRLDLLGHECVGLAQVDIMNHGAQRETDALGGQCHYSILGR